MLCDTSIVIKIETLYITRMNYPYHDVKNNSSKFQKVSSTPKTALTQSKISPLYVSSVKLNDEWKMKEKIVDKIVYRGTPPPH